MSSMRTIMLPNGQIMHTNMVEEQDEMVNMKEPYLEAACGVRFSEYVQRTRTTDLPSWPYNGDSIPVEHPDLWHGRPLKVLLQRDATRWRMAKVKTFWEGLKAPDSPVANWQLHLEFTDTEDHTSFTTGDIVKIHGLQNAKYLNGRKGEVLNFVNDTGRFAVKYLGSDGEPQQVGVKPSNIRHVEVEAFMLNRCNIEGGGTMFYNDLKHPISFEWLQEATPKVNLYEDGWSIRCPTCHVTFRDHEMAVQADEGVAQETECSVCLETTQCLPLGNCSHFLCNQCFQDCKRKADGSPIFRLEDIQVDDSPEELARQREELQELTQWGRSTREEEWRILEYIEDIAAETSDNDRESLIAFKRWLLVTPLHIWGTNMMIQEFVRLLDPHAAAILVERVENLRGTDEWQKFVRGVMEETRRVGLPLKGHLSGIQSSPQHAELMNDHVVYHNYLMTHMTEKVGLRYEQGYKDFRTAISWYTKTLVYPPLFPACLEPMARASSLSNLGLAQKHMGLYDSAEANYRQAIEAAPPGAGPLAARTNLKTLQTELKQWIGTSGTVTPRMEE